MVVLTPNLLRMNKVLSEDSARRAVKKIGEEKGEQWLQHHLLDCCSPLLNTPWILDIEIELTAGHKHILRDID
ncbi:MAG: hypothetical protein KUG80_07045 [Gammaproteobacteria bacterium]|nr:hypothetical protein [Gammaproteobacteria bacterium]